MHSLHSEPQACLVFVIASNCYRKQTEFCYLRLWRDYMQEFKFKTEIFLSYLFTFFFAINLKLKCIDQKLALITMFAFFKERFC